MALRILLLLGIFLFILSIPQYRINRALIHPFFCCCGCCFQLIVKDGNRRLMQTIDCGGLCSDRCSAHSRPNLCKRACGTCCVRCKCVPPGTSGNREICGTCYTDMTTHGNKTKCP
ncbi:snakin-2-like [Senna tora]|uniref:Snakin-2-like n=1 Tax=Senna tora TaxID=362788 RepID=A0A834X4D4_9FABA|nr:snakin-2-like [Senna tora]